MTNHLDYTKYFFSDSTICGGEPVIKGTRVTLRTLLASLAEGATVNEISEDFRRLLRMMFVLQLHI